MDSIIRSLKTAKYSEEDWLHSRKLNEDDVGYMKEIKRVELLSGQMHSTNYLKHIVLYYKYNVHYFIIVFSW